MRPDDLAALHKLARLRSDREMRKFKAFRDHVLACEARIEELKTRLSAAYATEGGFSLASARQSHELTRHIATELRQYENEMMELRPRFEAARQQVMQEFGRAEVLDGLHKQAVQTLREERASKAEQLAKV